MQPLTFTSLLAHAIDILQLLILLDVIFSWVVVLGKMSSYHPIPRTLRSIVSPILTPVRKLIPADKTGGMDISPIVVILLLRFIQSAILR